MSPRVFSKPGAVDRLAGLDPVSAVKPYDQRPALERSAGRDEREMDQVKHDVSSLGRPCFLEVEDIFIRAIGSWVPRYRERLIDGFSISRKPMFCPG